MNIFNKPEAKKIDDNLGEQNHLVNQSNVSDNAQKKESIFNKKFEIKHPKIKLTVSVILLFLSFVGMLYIDFAPNQAWKYWTYMIPIFAVLCMWLSWLNTKNGKHISGVSIIQAFFHWLTLLASVFIVSTYVDLGLIGSITAGLILLTLLSIITILAGIYLDITFLFIGSLQILLAIASALFIKYLMIIAVPLLAITLFFVIWLNSGKKKSV